METKNFKDQNGLEETKIFKIWNCASFAEKPLQFPNKNSNQLAINKHAKFSLTLLNHFSMEKKRGIRQLH